MSGTVRARPMSVEFNWPAVVDLVAGGIQQRLNERLKKLPPSRLGGVRDLKLTSLTLGPQPPFLEVISVSDALSALQGLLPVDVGSSRHRAGAGSKSSASTTMDPNHTVSPCSSSDRTNLVGVNRSTGTAGAASGPRGATSAGSSNVASGNRRFTAARETPSEGARTPAGAPFRGRTLSVFDEPAAERPDPYVRGLAASPGTSDERAATWPDSHQPLPSDGIDDLTGHDGLASMVGATGVAMKFHLAVGGPQQFEAEGTWHRRCRLHGGGIEFVPAEDDEEAAEKGTADGSSLGGCFLSVAMPFHVSVSRIDIEGDVNVAVFDEALFIWFDAEDGGGGAIADTTNDTVDDGVGRGYDDDPDVVTRGTCAHVAAALCPIKDIQLALTLGAQRGSGDGQPLTPPVMASMTDANVVRDSLLREARYVVSEFMVAPHCLRIAIDS